MESQTGPLELRAGRAWTWPRLPGVGARSFEALPGFLGWFEASQAPAGAFILGTSGVRRVAAFDHELQGDELAEAFKRFDEAPSDCDPLQQARIEVFAYFAVRADVEGLHLRPPEEEAAVVRVLDPDGRIGLAAVMVRRVIRVFPDRSAGEALVRLLRLLRIACEVEEREDYTVADLIVDDPSAIRREVERRRASGGPLHRVPFREGRRPLLERYEV